MSNSSNYSVSLKFSLIHSLLIIAIMGIFTTGMSIFLTNRLNARTERDLKQQAFQLKEYMSAYHMALAESANKMSAMFRTYFPEEFFLDPSKKVIVDGKFMPVLKNGREILNNDNRIVDHFTSVSKAVSTIFVRSGDDFVRIATSLKKEDGSRAIGTKLELSHPAYQLLLRNGEYVGKATLFGKDYLTKYQPITNRQGEVIAVLFIGIDFTEGLAALKNTIRSFKIAKTGYFYALDANEGKDYGMLQIHPIKEGQNILKEKSPDGREFIKEILTQREGVIRYSWFNKELGETIPREKLVAYQHLTEWNWIVCAGAPLVELNSEATTLRKSQALATLLVAVILVLLMLSMVRFERKLTGKLQRSENLFQTLATHAPVGIIQTDAKGECFYVNAAWCQMTGLSQEQSFGRSWLTALNVDERDKFFAKWCDAISSKQKFSIECRFMTLTGPERWIYMIAAPLGDDTDNATSYIGSVIDISERKLSEEKISMLNAELESRVLARTAQLEQLNSELEAFSYSVSHDMRAPLIRATHFADILQEECAAKLTKEELHYIVRLKAATQRMMELIDALLTLSRVSCSALQITSVNLSEIASETVNGLQEEEPCRKVALTVAEGMIVNADPTLMRSLLENLIGNAWKYSSKKEHSIIEFGKSEREGENLFFIRDNGVGFDSDCSPDIFAPFRRLHNDKDFTGIGIGLATVQRIIRRHGGRIWAESIEGKGATLYFTLPQSTEPGQSPTNSRRGI